MAVMTRAQVAVIASLFSSSGRSSRCRLSRTGGSAPLRLCGVRASPHGRRSHLLDSEASIQAGQVSRRHQRGKILVCSKQPQCRRGALPGWLRPHTRRDPCRQDRVRPQDRRRSAAPVLCVGTKKLRQHASRFNRGYRYRPLRHHRPGLGADSPLVATWEVVQEGLADMDACTIRYGLCPTCCYRGLSCCACSELP